MCIGCGGGGSFVQFAVGGIALEEGVGIPVHPKKVADVHNAPWWLTRAKLRLQCQRVFSIWWFK